MKVAVEIEVQSHEMLRAMLTVARLCEFYDGKDLEESVDDQIWGVHETYFWGQDVPHAFEQMTRIIDVKILSAFNDKYQFEVLTGEGDFRENWLTAIEKLRYLANHMERLVKRTEELEANN